VKNSLWKILLTAAVLVVLAVGIYVSTRPGPKHEEKPESVIQVQAVRPQAGGVERLCVQPATVESFEYVNLFSEVTGILTDQVVDIYSSVQKGDVLARVRAPDISKEKELAKAALIKAEDQVEVAQEHVETARARYRAAQAMVRRRQAEVIAAKAFLVFRDAILARITELVSGGGVEKELGAEERDRQEAAKWREKEALLAVDESKELVKAKDAEIEQAEAALKVAKASVGVAKAALDKAEVFVKFTEIKAPFRGVITFRSLNNNAFIRAKEQGSQVPLLTLKRTDKFRIVTYVPDVDVPYVQVGDPVTLKIYTLGMDFPGKVARRALSQQEGNRLMRTEIDMDNDRGLLQDGMYGDVAIRVSNVAKVNPNVVTIPSVCLQDEGQAKERIVYTLRPVEASQERGRARQKQAGSYRVHVAQVLVGYNQNKGRLNKSDVNREDLKVEILQGLTPADLVIKGRVSGLTEGSIVEVKD
jgi:RND family efflux transporter MFP subunit